MSENYTFVMEKNLDHFNASSPGNFTINLWTRQGEFLRTLGYVKDDNRTSGSVYQVKAQLPHEHGPTEFIIQAVYNTNNQKAPAQFFQCSNFEIVPRPN